ncbi:MAG: ORF6N domain-containing protein [Spirochaetes bacterium]|nr:MAG: ORF6N domain-containing protein [Spirochaetota bacterium]
MIDADIAELYGVPTKALNQAVKRNPGRFPADFMFQLNEVEKDEVVTNCDHLARLKFSKALPHAFTEHGAIMLAAILNTPRAVEMSTFVVRAFIKLREILSVRKELSRKFEELERKVGLHDEAIKAIIQSIRGLMETGPKIKKRKIGFK